MSIAALTPINITAALVVSKGVHYQPDCTIQVKEYIGPPAMIARHKLPKNPSFTDLTGIKKGRLKVIGLMEGERGKWVVRCVCGTYTTRSAKSIKSIATNPSANFDACRECAHAVYRKRKEIYRTTGKDMNEAEAWS